MISYLAALLENAYHAGPLAAAQPGITLADPLVATTWGGFVFGEHVPTGPDGWGSRGRGVPVTTAGHP